MYLHPAELLGCGTIEPKDRTSKEGATAILSPMDLGRQAWRMMPGDAACWALQEGKTGEKLCRLLTPAAPLTLHMGMEGRGFPTGPHVT